MKRSSIVFLFVLALFVRMMGQRVSPPGFHADEAAFGYNAYSILKTGKDEFGHPFPLILESVGDYKSALYSYLVIPFMVFLGPTELAVRFPSIFFGSCSVVLAYLLARALRLNNSSAVIAGIFVCFSPWHILQSRFTAETTVAAFFVLAMVLFLVRWYENQKQKTIFEAAVCAALAVYVYNSARVTVPLLLLAFLFLAWSKIKVFWRQILFAILLGSIVLFPLLNTFLNNFDALVRRPSAISIFNQEGMKGQLWEETTTDPSGQNPMITRFFHNKIRTYGREALRRYIQHFNIGYIAISGDPFERFQTPGSGVLLWIVLIFALAGGHEVSTKKVSSQTWKLIIAWAFLSPIVSSMSIYTPNSLHTLDQVFPICILAALGFFKLIKQYSPRKFVPLYSAIGILFVVNFLQFLYGYFIIVPQHWDYARNWSYGAKEVSQEVNLLTPDYREFVFFGGLLFDNLAFNLRYDPALFQQEVVKIPAPGSALFDHVAQFGKFKFRNYPFSQEQLVPGVAYVGMDQSIEMTDKLQELAVITSPDGKLVHRIVTLK